MPYTLPDFATVYRTCPGDTTVRLTKRPDGTGELRLAARPYGTAADFERMCFLLSAEQIAQLKSDVDAPPM